MVWTVNPFHIFESFDSCWFSLNSFLFDYLYAGLELLIGLLGSSNTKQQFDGAVALCKLANKAMTLSPIDAAPPSPTPQVNLYPVCLSSHPNFE